MRDAPLLAVDRLRVDFVDTDSGGKKTLRAVDDVSFNIMPGEILGLCGESGSGKSTLAGALLRTLRAPAVIRGGDVRLQGKSIYALSDDELRDLRFRRASLVVQSALDALNPLLRVVDHIVDTIEAHEPTRDRKKILARAQELCAFVGVDPARLQSYPHELSGGMRQRVVIAIALALDPELVILDEPTTALDVRVQREILDRLLALQREQRFAVLLVTHDVPLLLEITHRIAVLYGGRLCEIGPTEALSKSAAHPYTRGLLTAFPSLYGPRAQGRSIPGAPPSIRTPPPGCRFHPRCSERLTPCDRAQPALLQIGSTHEAACYAVEEAARTNPGARP